jgi:hypothetical protein
MPTCSFAVVPTTEFAVVTAPVHPLEPLHHVTAPALVTVPFIHAGLWTT